MQARGGYFVSKIKEIWWLHIITFLMIAALLLLGTPTLDFLKSLLKYVIPNIFLFHSFIPNRYYYFSFNSVSWYLSDYIFFCFLAPMILELLGKLKGKKIIVTAFVLLVIEILIAVIFKDSIYEHAILYISPIYRSIDFIFGMLLGHVFRKKLEEKETNKFKIFNKIMLFIGISGMVALILLYRFIPSYLSWGVLFTPVSCIIIYFGATIECKLNGKIKVVFENIARYSFEMFMLHQIVIRYLGVLENRGLNLNPFVWFVLVLGITFFGAIFIKKIQFMLLDYKK